MKVTSHNQKGGVTAGEIDIRNSVVAAAKDAQSKDMSYRIKLIGAFVVGSASVIGTILAALQYFGKG